jgi:hypothetical protein
MWLRPHESLEYNGSEKLQLWEVQVSSLGVVVWVETSLIPHVEEARLVSYKRLLVAFNWFGSNTNGVKTPYSIEVNCVYILYK